MGYMRHNAILVTGSYGEFVEKAHAFAKHKFHKNLVSPISWAEINGVKSFAVFPDGSKEGWAESEKGDRNRNAFLFYLELLKCADGSSPLDWVEVQYGDDDKEIKIVRHSDEIRGKKHDNTRET